MGCWAVGREGRSGVFLMNRKEEQQCLLAEDRKKEGKPEGKVTAFSTWWKDLWRKDEEQKKKKEVAKYAKLE